MEKSDSNAFAQIMTLLGVIFDREVTKELIGAYFGSLRDLSLEEMEIASKVATARLKFFPKPAELREFARGGTQDQIASRQFDVAVDAARHYGAYRSPPDFEDPVTQETIAALGGWVSFCRDEQDEHFARQEWIRIYTSYGTIRDDADRTRLIGEHEIVNRRLGEGHRELTRLGEADGSGHRCEP